MGRRKQNFHRLLTPGNNYQKQYQEYRSKGISKREAKQYARMVMVGKKAPFTEIEHQFMEEHPEYRGKVTEEVQDVRGYTDFQIIDGEPFLLIDWEPTPQHLAFCNIDITRAKSSFNKAGNKDNYKKLMGFLNQDDNLTKYGTNIYDPTFEEILADPESDQNNENPESEEEPKPEEDPNPRGKSPRKTPRKHPRSHYLVGPPIP